MHSCNILSPSYFPSQNGAFHTCVLHHIVAIIVAICTIYTDEPLKERKSTVQKLYQTVEGIPLAEACAAAYRQSQGGKTLQEELLFLQEPGIDSRGTSAIAHILSLLIHIANAAQTYQRALQFALQALRQPDALIPLTGAIAVLLHKPPKAGCLFLQCFKIVIFSHENKD